MERQYAILLSCTKCGGMHDSGQTITLVDGPTVKQSIAELFKEKELPKSLSELTCKVVSCPTTGKQFTPQNTEHIFLVPRECTVEPPAA